LRNLIVDSTVRERMRAGARESVADRSWAWARAKFWRATIS
jgi:hypothetical protein